MLIRTANNLADENRKTYLSFNEVAGTGVLRWKNFNQFGASYAVQIGKTGEEQSEVMLLGTATPAGTAGTLTANTAYAHTSDTPLYPIIYDQVVFEKSSTGTAGTAAPITDGTITIQPDSLYTTFEDATGTTTDAYRTYFRNSVLNQTSTESDWIVPSGATFYSLSAIRDRAKEKLWDSSYINNDSTINNWINEWLDELTNTAIGVNEDYAIGTVSVAFGTDSLGTVTSTDFKQVKRLWITWDGVNYYNSQKLPSNAYLPDQTFTQASPYHSYLGDSIFEVHPNAITGTAKISYYKLNPKLSNDTDEIPVPMRGYTKSFVDYCYAQALLKDNRGDEYQLANQRVAEAKAQFQQELTPRDKSSATKVIINDTLGGDFGGWM